jgi:hypothetical protein
VIIEHRVPDAQRWESLWPSPALTRPRGFPALIAAPPRLAVPVTSRRSSLMLPEEIEADAMQFTTDPFTAWIEAHRAEMRDTSGVSW